MNHKIGPHTLSCCNPSKGYMEHKPFFREIEVSDQAGNHRAAKVTQQVPLTLGTSTWIHMGEVSADQGLKRCNTRVQFTRPFDKTWKAAVLRRFRSDLSRSSAALASEGSTILGLHLGPAGRVCKGHQRGAAYLRRH